MIVWKLINDHWHLFAEIAPDMFLTCRYGDGSPIIRRAV